MEKSLLLDPHCYTYAFSPICQVNGKTGHRFLSHLSVSKKHQAVQNGEVVRSGNSIGKLTATLKEGSLPHLQKEIQRRGIVNPIVEISPNGGDLYKFKTRKSRSLQDPAKIAETLEYDFDIKICRPTRKVIGSLSIGDRVSPVLLGDKSKPKTIKLKKLQDPAKVAAREAAEALKAETLLQRQITKLSKGKISKTELVNILKSLSVGDTKVCKILQTLKG